MSARPYRSLTRAAEAAFSVGEFQHEFTVEEEQALVASGAIEVLPCTYRVLTDTPVFDVTCSSVPPEFTRALPLGQELQLVAGGHIERVEEAATPAAVKRTKTKED